MSMTKTQQDALEQLYWSARALPIRVASRVAPGRTARRARGARRLHLGCGANVLPGWANLDMGGPKGVVRYDLSRPLPVADGSVDLVFTEHFIEHVDREGGLALLRECARALVPSGVLRVSTPDLRRLVEVYLEGGVAEWSDMGWNPETPCDLLNEGMRLWGHKYLWDEDSLRRALVDSGFSSVTRVARHDSVHAGLRGLETRPDHGDLILEATR